MATQKYARNPACMKRFGKLEDKVFNGFSTKLDVLKAKVDGLEKLTYAILAGSVLTLAAAVVRMFMGV